MSKALFTLLFVALFACSVVSQCPAVGSHWTCLGGEYQTLSFEDDDDVQVSRVTTECSIFQEASWDWTDGGFSVDYDALSEFFSSCSIIPEDSSCECIEGEEAWTVNTECTMIGGPNGEICSPAKSTAECNFRTCPFGEDLVVDPDFEPSANGCGPQSIPITAPSLSFFDCCAEHDYCYSNCTKSKKLCDDEFYSCTYCSCEEEYGSGLDAAFCREMACIYWKAVDEFGCGAFESSQGNACMCTGDSRLAREYADIPNKFGDAFDGHLDTRLICSSPFNPTCNAPAPPPPSNAPVSNVPVPPTVSNAPSQVPSMDPPSPPPSMAPSSPAPPSVTPRPPPPPPPAQTPTRTPSRTRNPQTNSDTDSNTNSMTNTNTNSMTNTNTNSMTNTNTNSMTNTNTNSVTNSYNTNSNRSDAASLSMNFGVLCAIFLAVMFI